MRNIPRPEGASANSSAGIPSAGNYATVSRYREHSSPFVRGSVLRFLSYVEPQSVLGPLLDALSDPAYVVRENAIDELDNLGVVESAGRIRTLLNDPEPDVREAAKEAIANLLRIEQPPPDGLPSALPLSAQFNNINDVSSALEFEHLCVSLLRHIGYASFEVGKRGGRDSGVDIVATDTNNAFVVIECKWTRARRRVDSTAIYAVRGAVDMLRADRGILITNSAVTNAARLAATSANVEVWDSDFLANASESSKGVKADITS
ncbi:MAG: restriction endonuclease [Dehalococcoidia bacterium]